MPRTPSILCLILSASGLVPAAAQAAPATQPQTRPATQPAAPAATVPAASRPVQDKAKPLPKIPSALAAYQNDLTSADPAVRLKACQDLSAAEKLDQTKIQLLPLLARMGCTDPVLAVQDGARQPFRAICDKTAEEAVKQPEILKESKEYFLFVLQDPLVVLELKQGVMGSLQRITTGEHKAAAANALLPEFIKLASDPLMGEPAIAMALQLAPDAADEAQARIADLLLSDTLRPLTIKQMTITRPPVRALIRALAAPESRMAALALLKAQPHKDFIEPLLPMLTEKEADIRCAAMDALQSCIQSHEKPDQLAADLPQLGLALGKATRDSDFFVRTAALTLSRTLKPAKPAGTGRGRPPAEPPAEQPKAEEILTAIRDPRQSERGILAALQLSGNISSNASLTSALQAATTHKSPAVRLAVATALQQRAGVSNESAALGLMKTLRSETDPQVRTAYISMLTNWERNQDQARGKPMDKLTIKDAKTAEAVMRAARSVSDDRRKVFDYANSPSLPLTEVAPLVKVLTIALSDRVSEIRIAAAEALVKSADQAKPAVPTLLKETITHWNDDCRAAGYGALLAIDPENPDVVAALAKAAEDPALSVRQLALKSAVLSGDKQAAASLIAGAWNDELTPSSGGLSYRAILADLLKTLKPAQLAACNELPENLLQSLRDPNPTRRMQAMSFLTQQLGPIGRAAMPVLIESIDSIEPEVVRQAVATIKALGEPPAEAISAIARRASQGPTRAGLLVSLGEFGAAARPALPLLQEAAGKTTDTNFKGELERIIEAIKNPPPQP